jgi:hypothetical protein
MARRPMTLSRRTLVRLGGLAGMLAEIRRVVQS